MDIDRIENIILGFCDKYDINLEEDYDYVGEMVYQNDNAYLDAVKCFVEILYACMP